jgi:hypothetical protein
MLDNMGFKINNDESKLIVTSICSGKSNQVSLTDFMDMIFNTNDQN